MPFSFFTFPDPGVAQTDQYVLLHQSLPEWVQVNGMALGIVQQLACGKTTDEVSGSLAEQYGISDESAKADVNQVAEKLKGFLFHDEGQPLSRVPQLKSLYLHITTRCNLSCPQCYIHQERMKPTDLSTDAIMRMMDEMVAWGGSQVTLSGGEPLLHPDMKLLVGYAQKKGITVQILTNGTLIDSEWAAFFADHQVSNIQISLDGSCKEVHDAVRGSGTYANVMKAVNHLQNAGIGNGINFCTTVMKQNLHDLESIIETAQRIGVPYVRFLPLRHKGRAARQWDEIYGADIKDYEQFYQQVWALTKNPSCHISISCGLSGFMLFIPKDITEDRLWCPVGKKIVVDADGNAYPCVLMMEPEFCMGNIYTARMDQIIQSKPMKDVCDALANRRNRIAECATCPWRNFCQAGCMGQTLDHKGTIWDRDFFCKYRKQMYEASFNAILNLQA